MPALAHDAALLCVYRSRYVDVVLRLAGQAREQSLGVYLWTIEEPHPALEAWTVGSGRGARGELLTRLAAAAAADGRRRTLLCDDDAEIVSGTLGDLLVLAHRGAFALAQPAHSWDSIYAYPFLAGRPLSTARSTTFVEIGPVLLVDPGYADRVFPRIAACGMGWGLDVSLSHERRPDERFGIVDAVRMRHLGMIAADYPDDDAEHARLAESLRQAGARRPADLFATRGRWPVWRAEPGWGTTPASR